jgi:hypothetical protein
MQHADAVPSPGCAANSQNGKIKITGRIAVQRYRLSTEKPKVRQRSKRVEETAANKHNNKAVIAASFNGMYLFMALEAA